MSDTVLSEEVGKSDVDRQPEDLMKTLKRIVSGSDVKEEEERGQSKRNREEEDVPFPQPSAKKVKRIGPSSPQLSPPTFFRAHIETNILKDEKEVDSAKQETPDIADWREVSAPLAPVVQGRTIQADERDEQKIGSGEEQHPERRVLVVDDSFAVRRFVQRTFERRGYRVDVCQNGWQAFAQMQNNLYDFVFLDIEMPVMNGFRCVQALREWENKVNRKEKQVICALTSHTELHERQLSQDLGMNFFEAKPTRPQRLLDIVNQAVHCAKGDAHASAALTAIATANALGKLQDLQSDDEEENNDNNHEQHIIDNVRANQYILDAGGEVIPATADPPSIAAAKEEPSSSEFSPVCTSNRKQNV
eukprot:CAMPEP_0197304866 /NCGR_PEP_ID=MMETSP0891-20130614/511_1 /TAXON_ID=44058 ORGANISM="Aureoumbra lagunensis, Strain CCMP1510" /NCGR_SAMPLE_ID=MMETSP0891 /ASSEMBLY_ACC=CAM_ASM_000534 /LENGTH=360 /DNA_ID=CAMNT_0042785223 /DNA_START=54 /DNA_END=1136 /DNA_ORIENTATION=+